MESGNCVYTVNIHLHCKGKYHCTADLLFDWLEFSYFGYVELDSDLQVWSNPNQSNRSVVQWYFPLRSKWVFSASNNPSHSTAMSSTDIRKSAKDNLRDDGSSKIQFRVDQRSECSSSCRDVIEGACENTGGICDFLYQCTGKETDKVR